MNIAGLKPSMIPGMMDGNNSMSVPKPKVDVKEESVEDSPDADFIANKGLAVAKSLVGSLETMLSEVDAGGSTINIQDLKDITGMLKDVFVMIEKYDKQVGGGASKSNVDDGLAMFLSRRKA